MDGLFVDILSFKDTQTEEEKHHEKILCTTPKLLSPSGQQLSYKFSDIDLLESGRAKETLRDTNLLPRSKKSGKVLCHILRENKDSFWMFQDKGGRFMMSAKKVGNHFYISQYKNFPYTFESESKLLALNEGDNFCAVLRLNKYGQYVLFNRGCECCDEILGKHTCGAKTKVNGDRQELLSVKHTADLVRAGEDVIQCNAVNVQLPQVHKDRSREVWCPRFEKPGVGRDDLMATYNGLEGRSRPIEDAASSEEMECEQKEHDDFGQYNGTSNHIPGQFNQQQQQQQYHSSPQQQTNTRHPVVHMDTKRPRYDKYSGSLRMKFYDGRVMIASAKNLIFCEMKGERERGVLQFGKASKNRFNIDFSAPLSPIQAFGIGLSLFSWQGPKSD